MRHFSSTLLLLLYMVSAPVVAETSTAGDEERAIVTRYLLMDTRGNAVTNKDFPGSFQLIAFGYTYCPDICPTTLSEMSVIMKRLGEQSERVQPIFISVDPERDTPATLSRYTAYFHPRIIGLTGEPALVRRVADNFKVRYEKYYEPGGDPRRYSMDHSAGMYLLGPDGSFAAKFAYAAPISDVTARIRTMLEHTDTAHTSR